MTVDEYLKEFVQRKYTIMNHCNDTILINFSKTSMRDNMYFSPGAVTDLKKQVEYKKLHFTEIVGKRAVYPK